MHIVVPSLISEVGNKLGLELNSVTNDWEQVEE